MSAARPAADYTSSRAPRLQYFFEVVSEGILVPAFLVKFFVIILNFTLHKFNCFGTSFNGDPHSRNADRPDMSTVHAATSSDQNSGIVGLQK